MARTAPIPNIPAIPGMNPGMWIMAGGGLAGGSGGKGANGNAPGQGASGNNGGNNANGGGKNAGSCGPGSGGGCPNPVHGNTSTHAGDPIDPSSGRVYTVPVVDLSLPGPIPLTLSRSYSSSIADDDLGLGHGWTHSLGWVVEERRRTLRVIEPGADTTRAELIEVGGTVRLPCGVLSRHEWGYSLQNDGLGYLFALRDEKRYLLTRIVDRNDNAISLHYEGGRLTSVIDSAGRVINVRRDERGHILAFEVKNALAQGRWTTFRTYEYDEKENLVGARDPAGHATTFEYDEDHRLLRRRQPGGLTVEFRYDDAGRCFETWCHRGDDDALDEGVPALLADHTTPAKGFMHVRVDHADDGAELVTSRASRRISGKDRPDQMTWGGGVHSFSYDAAGEPTGYVDALGHASHAHRDHDGRLTRSIDPAGAVTEHLYDERGDVIESRDAAGGSSRYRRDARGNLLAIEDDLGLVASFEYDGRGLPTTGVMPNGGITRMEYDAYGNRVTVVEPDGGTRHIRYDFLGRMVSATDERGGETLWVRDACDRVRSVRLPSGATVHYEHDADGNLVKQIDADGRLTTLRWGGVGVVTEVVHPDGRTVRYRYDREQDLVRIVDEGGHEHRFERDPEGRVVAERTFDGRKITYSLDAMGQIIAVREGTRLTEIRYDPCGRVVERATSNGLCEKTEYDAVGRVLRVSSADAVCDYTYDLRGRVVREAVTRGGKTSVVETTYDASDWPVRAVGPFGAVTVERDAAGRVVRLDHGDVAPVRFEYDAAGRLLQEILPGGASIAQDFGADGQATQIRVRAGRSQSRVGAGQPAWIGDPALGETFSRSYGYSPSGLLTTIGEGAGDATELRRDHSGRVIEKVGGKGRKSAKYGYGPSGEVYQPEEPREYGPGGRVLRRGAFTFGYDDWGRVTEKRAESGEVWGFEWDDNDWLTAATLPDGRTVRFAYDPFARRTEKRVERTGKTESVTRYEWYGDALVREIREAASAGGDPIVEERSYVVLPGSFLPLAHRETRGGEAGPVAYYVDGPNGAPEALVKGDGALLGAFDAELFGRVQGDADKLTPLRFPGQYADEETGLHYNRNRYYDPETGAYLSPEPLRIEGGLRPYAYVDNRPAEYVDIDGLVRCTLTRSSGEPITRSSGGSPTTLHPAVEKALVREPARSNHDPRPADQCAEPHVLSEHLRDWERRNSPRSCQPGSPGWKRNLGSALDEVQGMQANTGTQDIPPCPNCSQLIPRLWTMGGRKPPRPSQVGGGSNPQNPGYYGNPSNRLSRPNRPGGIQDLGTYRVEGNQFQRVT